MVPILLFLILLVLAWPYLLMTGILAHAYTNTALVTAVVLVAAILLVLRSRKQMNVETTNGDATVAQVEPENRP